MKEVFHSLETLTDIPERLNNPFDYEPHPLCLAAAKEVCDYLKDSHLMEEVSEGKMLGVLVCRSTEGRIGFLAAYSGQLGGREDWPWFVPAVFDYLQPDGYFKREEAEISAINSILSTESIAMAERERKSAEAVRRQAEQEIVAYKRLMSEAKARRDTLRGKTDEASLVGESQFQKAELRRLKKRWALRIAEAEEPWKTAEQAVSRLKEERRQRSDALQRWLFDHFVMLNAKGNRRTLTDIFSTTPQGMPPSGAGECCAPKLLQYAFLHGLRPLQIAEFWQGRSPKQEVRHAGQFYPACRGKCKPILEWMLDGIECQTQQTGRQAHSLPVIYEDEAIIVVDKPTGLLSVPGKTGEESVESLLRTSHGEVYMVHRLDQDTSGLLVAALNETSYHTLQRQFLARTIYKKYIALLDGTPAHKHGTIRLPLRPDPLDRPRQVADPKHGKEAVTDYEVMAGQKGCTRIALMPHTGRTHQLRMHCAHAEGLNCPIVGDRLYGHPAQRLCLHAAELSFNHPSTGKRLFFRSESPF